MPEYDATRVAAELEKILGRRVAQRILDRIGARRVGDRVVIDEEGRARLEGALTMLLGARTTERILSRLEPIGAAGREEKPVQPSAPVEGVRLEKLEEVSRRLADPATLFTILLNSRLVATKRVELPGGPENVKTILGLVEPRGSYYVSLRFDTETSVKLAVVDGAVEGIVYEEAGSKTVGVEALAKLARLRGTATVDVFALS